MKDTVNEENKIKKEKPACLVLGGLGFIGSYLTEALVKKGYPVTVFDLPNVSLSNINHIISEVKLVQGNLTREEDIRPLLESHPILFHFIGFTLPDSSNANSIYDVQSNVVSTLKLLDMAVKCKVQKFIFPSSGGTVYGPSPEIPRKEMDPTEPVSSYGITKLTIEKYLRLYRHLYNLDYLCFRFSNPYGERQLGGNQGIIMTFLKLISENNPLPVWGDGKIVRDYIYIDDAIEAVIRGLNYKGDHKIFNIGSGVGVSIMQLIEILKTVTGKYFEIQNLPNRHCDVPWSVLNIDLARRELAFSPSIALSAGIEKLWKTKFNKQSLQ